MNQAALVAFQCRLQRCCDRRIVPHGRQLTVLFKSWCTPVYTDFRLTVDYHSGEDGSSTKRIKRRQILVSNVARTTFVLCSCDGVHGEALQSSLFLLTRTVLHWLTTFDTVAM